VLTAQTASAETLDINNKDQQTRALVGLGLGHIGNHVYRNVGASRFWAGVLTVATVAGASIAYDQLSKGRIGSGNAIASGVGAIGGVFTFNLFDGSDNGSRAEEKSTRQETRTSQDFKQDYAPKIENKPEINIENKPVINFAPPATTINVFPDRANSDSKDTKINSGKESKGFFYPSPGQE